MTTALIPIPGNATIWSIEKPVVMTADGFDTYWPLVSTVYTKIGSVLTQQRGDVLVQKYECRLRKSKKGGKAPPAREGVKKKYSATIRRPGLCQVRMKITRTVAAPVTVTIERLDSEEHHHDLERGGEIALATAEAEKGYAAAQVMNVLKGVGTPQGNARLLSVDSTWNGEYEL